MTADRNTKRFLFSRALLSAEYAARRRLPGLNRTARMLLHDGVVIVPGFLNTAEIERMRGRLPARDVCVPSAEGTRTLTYYDADRISALAPFFGSSWIRDVMRVALGATAHRLRTAVQYRDYLGETGVFEQFFHIDTWLPRFKAFLYLTDVDAGGGPLRYLPGSNHGLWRLRSELEVYRLYPTLEAYVNDADAAYAGCFWPHEVRALGDRLGTEPVSLTGERGTLILFDARGLHATTPLQAARTILYEHWIKRGRHT